MPICPGVEEIEESYSMVPSDVANGQGKLEMLDWQVTFDGIGPLSFGDGLKSFLDTGGAYM